MRFPFISVLRNTSVCLPGPYRYFIFKLRTLNIESMWTRTTAVSNMASHRKPYRNKMFFKSTYVSAT